VNWAEEKFVKLFTRDTPTWLAWPWQARAVAPLLMRKLEADGRLAVGRLEPARAVALTIGLPIDVVEPGLVAMLEDGTLEARDDGLWWPRFEEAQESRKSEAQRSREYRARQRLESSTPTRHTASHGVTPRHTPSPSRTEQTRTDQMIAPQKPRRPSAQQEFFAWTQAEAAKANASRMPEAPPPPTQLNAQLKISMATIGRAGLEAAWREYQRDAYALERGLPWPLFVSKIPELHNRARSAPPKSKFLTGDELKNLYADGTQ
jgi:hypothetical protein